MLMDIECPITDTGGISVHINSDLEEYCNKAGRRGHYDCLTDIRSPPPFWVVAMRLVETDPQDWLVLVNQSKPISFARVQTYPINDLLFL